MFVDHRNVAGFVGNWIDALECKTVCYIIMGLGRDVNSWVGLIHEIQQRLSLPNSGFRSE